MGYETEQFDEVDLTVQDILREDAIYFEDKKDHRVFWTNPSLNKIGGRFKVQKK